MILPKVLRKLHARKSTEHRRAPLYSLYGSEGGLYREEYFNDVLYFERKRTERSGKPFLLMLVHIEDLVRHGQREETMKKIISALFSSTREIDIKGWVKYDAVIGVIYPEMCSIHKETVQKKVAAQLEAAFGAPLVRAVKIVCYLFPEENGRQLDEECGHLFYPDRTMPDRAGKRALYVKRMLDIAGSVVMLVIASPLLLIIALAVKFSSEGPVLFKQQRVGQFGKPFTFLKFRTMVANNDPTVHKEYIKKFILEQRSYRTERGGDDEEEKIYKIKDDPRVTPLGRFLRKTSLDELPQFINVLRGEMSLVGPRPPIPYELENYAVWHKRRIMEVKPGITGLWQVRGRSRTTFDEMVRMDLKYIREWSFMTDIKLLLQTPWAVLRGKGSY
ncbi:MAG: sugar transferase [Nitrospirota bacterium]